MKKIILSISLLFSVIAFQAQNPSFAWAKSVGGTSVDEANAVTTDASGNVYVTGSFIGTVDFDPGAGVTNLTASSIDAFVLKLSSAGNLVWVKKIGGTSDEYGYGISVDASGNVFTTGSFSGTVDFDPGVAVVNLTSAGLSDIFVSKLNSLGNYIWAKKIGGASDDYGNAITLDASGNVYTTGFFNGTVDFDPNATTVNLNGTGVSDMFISKLNATGNYVWAKKIGGNSSSYTSGNAIALDVSGNIYTSGNFLGTVDFNPGAATVNLSSLVASTNDVFVSKLDASGNYLWAKKMGGTDDDVALGIAIDGTGNVLSTGSFSGTVDFDPNVGIASLTSAGNNDIFISKLDASGNYLWAKNIGGTANDKAIGMAIDGVGCVYTTGLYTGTVDFDPNSGVTNLTGTNGIFISKLDGLGNYVWANKVNAGSFDKGNAIVVDASYNVYSVGNYSGVANFDPTGGTSNLTSVGNTDVFIQKLTQCTPPTVTVNSGTICAGESFTLVPNGATSYVYSGGSDVVNPSATESFTVIGNTIGGCSNFAISTITVNDLPIISVNSGLICSGQSFTMAPNGALTYTYSSGTDIVSPTINSTYSVTGTDANGCINSAISNVSVKLCSQPAGAALNFDGIDDIVEMPASSSLNDFGLGAFTLESWVYPNSFSAASSIIRKTGDYNLYFTNDGSLVAEVWFAGTSDGNFVVIKTQTAINLNAWFHVAFAWNGSSGSFYINGALVSTNSSYNYYPGSENLNLGASSLFGNNLDGLLDEVRIWNKALCQSEILNNMNGEIANTGSGLVANYHFNQGLDAVANTTVTSLDDASGNANNGTLTNFALAGATSNWVAPGAVTNGSVVTTFVRPTFTISGVNNICSGTTTTLTANGDALTYTWITGPYSNTYVVTPSVTATYSVIGTNSVGCLSDMVIETVTVNTLPIVTVNSGTICSGQTFTMISSGASTYTYSSGSAVVSPTANATYNVIGTSTQGCVSSNTAVVSVIVNTTPTVSVNSGVICAGQSFTIVPSGALTYTYSNGTDVVMPTSDATYSITGTDANGCVSSTEAVSSITVNALPNIMATTNNTLLCSGQTATLSVTGANTYTWNTTENAANIVVTPTAQTTYTVNGTDLNGCSNTITITQDVSLCTGIVTLNGMNASFISVYPNPNNGLFTIDLASASNVTITNALGEAVLFESFDDGKYIIDIQIKATGVYFVKVIQNNKQQVIKLIKE